MIYQFNTTDQIFALSSQCKRWKWCVDGARILAYIEPRESLDTSALVPAVNVPDATKLWLERP